MQDTKNLTSVDAISELKRLVNSAPTCMFQSNLTVLPTHVCPMHLQQVEDTGALWFFSSSESKHNQQIEADPRVQLLFSNHSDYQYLTVSGTATVLRNQQKIDELWNVMVSAWFPGGKNDPAVTLIKVSPESGYYWDTKHGKLVALGKIMISALTGRVEDDGGIQGTLHFR